MKKTFILLVTLFAFGFAQVGFAQEQTSEQEQSGKFPMITIPEQITEPLERAAYLAEHYWDNSDFNTLSDEQLDEGFTNLISLFSLMDIDMLEKNWSEAVKCAEKSKTGVARLLAVADKHLYSISSPSYNEMAYSALLRKALVSKKIKKDAKAPFQAQLVLLEMNKPGSPAVDLDLTLVDGTKAKLSDVNSAATILFFYTPGDMNCRLERFRLSQARLISYLERAGGVKIVAIYPGGDQALWDKYKSEISASWVNAYDPEGKIMKDNLYDLRTLPRIYLLDDKKNVLLKNATAEQTEQYLASIMQNAAAKQAGASAEQKAE